jgi:hypothetical protein
MKDKLMLFAGFFAQFLLCTKLGLGYNFFDFMPGHKSLEAAKLHVTSMPSLLVIYVVVLINCLDAMLLMGPIWLVKHTVVSRKCSLTSLDLGMLLAIILYYFCHILLLANPNLLLDVQAVGFARLASLFGIVFITAINSWLLATSSAVILHLYVYYLLLYCSISRIIIFLLHPLSMP